MHRAACRPLGLLLRKPAPDIQKPPVHTTCQTSSSTMPTPTVGLAGIRDGSGSWEAEACRLAGLRK